MRLWRLLTVYAFCGSASWASIALGAVHPKLLHLLVRINDLEQEVKEGGHLKLIKGDHLIVLRGRLNYMSKEPALVNFIGFRAKVPRKLIDDDLNVPIDTLELKRGWSSDKQGKTYKIEAQTGSIKHGEVVVSILIPELQLLRLQVGANEFSLKAKQSLNINQNDAIKVLYLKTNDTKIDQETRMEFKEQITEFGKKVELQLFYRSYLYASVFLNLNSTGTNESR